MTTKTFQNLLDSRMSFKTIPCNKELPNMKQQLKEYFVGTYELYERLFTVIKNNRSYYTKPQPLRHPLIFYFGHTAAFFVNKLIDKGLIKSRINEEYERMFAVGVDQMDWDDLNESHYKWPSVEDAKHFRDRVKQMVIDLIEESEEKVLTWESNMWIILMGIEHERIHLQTSSVIIRRLPIAQVWQPEWFKECPYFASALQKIPKNKFVHINQFQKQWTRQKQTTETYGWDNEFGHKSIKTKAFEASQMLVSNGEYFEFYKAGGYKNLKYWTEEGKNWLNSTKTQKPLFWEIDNSNIEDPHYHLRTMVNVIPMPWDWPVEINNLEAQAFCNWKSQKESRNIRLPTEDEYFAIRNLLPMDLNEWKHGQAGNVNLEYWFSPNPVNMFQTNGLYDIVGNVWQHTITPIYPFGQFEIHPVYEDFTTPTFDNRHNLIKGGSFISTGNQALAQSRYAFRRHFYQFAGLRYVESQNQTECSAEITVDQSDEAVEQKLKIQFGEGESYVKQILKFIEENIEKDKVEKSLVVGCSVGKLPLELSKSFKESYGIDYTARYFQMATRLLETNVIKYRSVEINLESFAASKNIHLYQMNPENTDSKKINEIDFMLIDGISIRKNTLSKAFDNCLKLLNDQKSIELLIVGETEETNQLKQRIGGKIKVEQLKEQSVKRWTKENDMVTMIYVRGGLIQQQSK